MTKERLAVVEAFNACINQQDVDGLSCLMTDGHRFVDSASGTVIGKAACIEAWKSFFSAFPDYRNHFVRMLVKGDKVVVVGHSSCSDTRLAGPALWQATVTDGCISEWCVIDDSHDQRGALGILD